MKFGLVYEMRRSELDDHAVIEKNMGFDIQTRRQSAGAVPAEGSAGPVAPSSSGR